MKVIVIGGSGFIGSHVADELTDQGHDVTIFDKVRSSYLKKGQKMVIGDFLDEKAMQDTLKGADIVYHFAGISDIDEATDSPLETVRLNIYGTAVILEACVKNHVKKFIFASSIYVYSKSGSFYRVSKQSSELLIEAFYQKYGLEYTILRYGSLYGPRSDNRNGIYRILYQAIKNKKIVYHGTVEDIREYIYAKDAAKLSVEILKEDYANQHIIITGQQVLSTKNLLNMVQGMLDEKADVVINTNTNGHHYKVTPYHFSPKVGKKLVANFYSDMGQGLLEVMTEIYKNVHNQLDVEVEHVVKIDEREQCKSPVQ